MSNYNPEYLGHFPYAKTGTPTSADLMNSLYSGVDAIVNSVTSDKSAFFLNTVNYRDINKLGSPGNDLLPCFNLWSDAKTLDLGGAEYNCPEYASYYGFITMPFTDTFPLGTTYDAEAEIVKHDRKGAGLGPRQFYFLSGVKTGDCDPNDPTSDQFCVGDKAYYPHGDIGWYWRLWGFWYYKSALIEGINREIMPENYKHEHYEEIAEDATIVDYNTDRNMALVVENGKYTSNYGRQFTYFFNPVTNQQEKLPCPYAINSDAAYYCTNLDNSLEVHEVSNKNPSIIPNFSDYRADITMTSSSGKVMGNVIIDHSGSGFITGLYPSGEAQAMTVGSMGADLSSAMRVHNLAKASQKPVDYSFDEYYPAKYADRDKLDKITEQYNVHVCPHTHKDEIENINEFLGNVGGMSTGRTIVSGEDCTNPYLCWLYQDKTNYWNDIQSAVSSLNGGDQTINITYSFARTGTAIAASSSQQSAFGINNDAQSDTWVNTQGTNHLNESGHSINYSQYVTEVEAAFDSWKTLIEKTYSGCNTSCGSGVPTKLTVNFINLGTEYSNAEGSAGPHDWRSAEDFPINSEVPVSMGVDIGTGYGPLNIGRIRVAVARTGDWVNNRTTAFAYLPDRSATSSRQGDIVINPNHYWKQDTDINTDNFGSVYDKEMSLRFILAHEIGHSLGFGHSNSAKCDTPMSPVYFWNESFESGFSGGLSEYTDGKCLKELYGDCQAGTVCYSGMKMTSLFQTPLTQTGFQSAYDDSVFYPWYWPINNHQDTPINVLPGIPIAECIANPQYCNSYPVWAETNVPNLENKFEQAELIFDGYETCNNCGLDHDGEAQFSGYGNYTFSNKFNKYKFFRIHNLNNYDMNFTFAPDDGLNDASKVNVGLFQKKEEEEIVAVTECGAGTGLNLTIPKHSSICVRRDYGEYTVGFRHFQKFLAGDQKVNQKLAEKDILGHDSYPDYYHNFPAREHYLFEKANHNVVNPFVMNDWLNMLEERFVIDETPPRTWNANSVYLDPVDYTELEGGGYERRQRDRNGLVYEYDQWLQPTYYNSYQNFDDYTVSPLEKENTYLADFIYHTGWVIQSYALESGSPSQDLTWKSGYVTGIDSHAAYLKRAVPYSGARYIYKFLQDLNVNVIALGEAKQALRCDQEICDSSVVNTELAKSDDGRSGLFTGPTGWIKTSHARPTSNQCDPASCGALADSGSASDLLSIYFDFDDPKTQGILPKGTTSAEDGSQWVFGNHWDMLEYGPQPLNDPRGDNRAKVGWPVSGSHANEIADLQCDMLQNWNNDSTDPASDSDPFALSIHQWNLNTNILGAKGAFNYAKGQIYPLHHGGGHCVSPSEPIMPSFIDFLTYQHIHYGDIYYLKKAVTGTMVTGGDYEPVGYTEYNTYFNHYREDDRGTGPVPTPKDCYPFQRGSSAADRSVAYGNYGWAESRGDGGAQDNPPCIRLWHPQTGGYSGFDPYNTTSPTGWITPGTASNGHAVLSEWNATGAGGKPEDFVVDYPAVPNASFEWWYYLPKPHMILKDDGAGNVIPERQGLLFNLDDPYDLGYLNVGYIDKGETAPDSWFCKNYESNSSLYTPINTSQILKVVRGGIVTDDALPYIVKTGGLQFPLHFYHQHGTHLSQVGSNTFAGIRGQNQDDMADFVGASQNVNFYQYGQDVPSLHSGVRNFFDTTVRDMADAIYEFNRIDGLWTGYNSGENYFPESGFDYDGNLKILTDYEMITRVSPPGPTTSGFVGASGLSESQHDISGGLNTDLSDYNSGDLFSAKIKDAFNISPVGDASVNVTSRSGDPLSMPMMMYHAENGALHMAFQKNVNALYRMPVGNNSAWNRNLIGAGGEVANFGENLYLSSLTGRHGGSPILYSRSRQKIHFQNNGSQRRLVCNTYNTTACDCESTFYPCLVHGAYGTGPNAAFPHKGQDYNDLIGGINSARPASFFWNSTRQPWKSTRLHAAQGVSDYFTGDHPLGGTMMFHWSGIFNLHPEIQMLGYMDANKMGIHSGEYGEGKISAKGRENKLLGYSAEYWPLDSTWRMGTRLAPHDNIYDDTTKGLTTTTAAMDLHFANYGPPKKVHYVTGASVFDGGSYYWPGCNFIWDDLLGTTDRENTHGKYCPKIIFRANTSTNQPIFEPGLDGALERMHPDEIIASGLPIVGCTWAERKEDCGAADDASGIWDMMLAGPDYKVVGAFLLGGINKAGDTVTGETIYWRDSENAQFETTGYGRYLYENTTPEIIGPDNWPFDAGVEPINGVTAGSTSETCDPNNPEVFLGNFYDAGVQDLALANFPSGSGLQITPKTFENGITGVISYKGGVGQSQFPDEGLAHFYLNNMHYGWADGKPVAPKYGFEPCLYDYSWMRETMLGGHSEIYTDFSGFSR